jgi:hypothetical protein
MEEFYQFYGYLRNYYGNMEDFERFYAFNGNMKKFKKFYGYLPL